MSLLFRVIYATGCRSTHHKFALDALTHLQNENASGWQKLFLKHHSAYLTGAKAPDTKFRDFRNHVLHVRDNYWGGAEVAARRWYDQTVDALKQQRWEAATYNAGVLSHYYTDVIQPFHTAQSQAESNIHRAAEWSINKAYRAIHHLTVSQKRFPDVELPAGDDWLEQAVRQGAETANPHYETLIEHYNFEVGVDDPPAGLDAPSREILSHLFGHAIVGFSRLLDRAIADADVSAPEVSVTLQGFVETLKIPIRFVTSKMADAKERAVVESMYRELKRTGKVDKSLPADDRAIRDLHAQEIGVVRPRPTPSAESIDSPPRIAREADVADTGPSSAPRVSSDTTSAKLRFYLETSDDLEAAPSIGPKTAARFAAIKIYTVADLLAANPESTASQLNTRHITSETIVDWQDQSRLVCQIPKLRGHDAQIMVGCGYRNVDSVAAADPSEMLEKIIPFTTTSAGQRIIRSGKAPDLEEVTNWIKWSQRARFLRAA